MDSPIVRMQKYTFSTPSPIAHGVHMKTLQNPTPISVYVLYVWTLTNSIIVKVDTTPLNFTNKFATQIFFNENNILKQ